MIGAIGMNGGTGVYAAQTARRPPPPPPDKDVFRAADQDADGTVSSAELDTLTQALSEVTGTPADTQQVLERYDTDGSGGLDGAELSGWLTAQGLGPPPGAPEALGGSPPVTGPGRAAAAYQEQRDGTIDRLLALLKDGSSALNTTA
ncbi:MAG: hypothetical protein D6708_00150 [Candidatus Dadabacteria bacterium]|nr:MAG: hypothetical protein D6708_00150 [Candidatus Dadabacteria bacterium]